MAAPALALAAIAVLALAALSAPARAQERCAPPLPQLATPDGQVFNASAYGLARWTARSAGGRRLPHAMHVWKGAAGGRTAYLTFDEISGTSGPNYHMDYRLKSAPAKIAWAPQRAPFAFDPRVIVRDGPLRGDWRVTNCAAR